jgi:hypothetical protein
MNKHSFVMIGAVIVIAGTVGYSALGAIAANDLQVRWHEPGSFDYLSISFAGKVGICNPSEYPANLKSYSVKMMYDSSDLGTFVTGGSNIASKSVAILPGTFSANDKRISEMFFAFLDTEFGGTSVTRIDSNKMRVQTTVESSIIGFIPVYVSNEYSGQEFLQMMNAKTKCDV